MLLLANGEYFGVTTIKRTIGDFDIVRTRFAPGTVLPGHEHDRDVLIVMANGARRDEIGKHSISCPSGSIILHSAFVPHQNLFVSSKASEVINVSIPRWLYNENSFDQIDSSRIPGSLPLQCDLLAARIEFETQIADDLSSQSIKELILEFADQATNISFHQSHINKSPWLNDIVDQLREKIAEPYCLDELAANVGKHPAHVARTFRRVFGCTVGQYLRGIRVALACSLLSSTNKTLSEIASESGFSDQPHLSRCFKSIFRTSPLQYRRTIRRNNDS